MFLKVGGSRDLQIFAALCDWLLSVSHLQAGALVRKWRAEEGGDDAHDSLSHISLQNCVCMLTVTCVVTHLVRGNKGHTKVMHRSQRSHACLTCLTDPGNFMLLDPDCMFDQILTTCSVFFLLCFRLKLDYTIICKLAHNFKEKLFELIIFSCFTAVAIFNIVI